MLAPANAVERIVGPNRATGRETTMTHDSPYLKPGRLADVIAALQFLGQYKDYKLSVENWNKKIASAPRSASSSFQGGTTSWAIIFDEHAEFFRKNDDGLISLVWRRAITKTQEGQRPPLEPGTISTLIDTAVRLYSTALEAKKADEARETQSTLNRRWWIQVAVSILTAVLAFVGLLLAARIKGSRSP